MNYFELIFYTYFTHIPHLLFKHAENIGDLGLAGVFSMLIHAQYLFWISTFILLLLNIEDKVVTTKLDQLGQYSRDTLVFNPFFSDLENWRNGFMQKLGESKFKRFAAIG